MKDANVYNGTVIRPQIDKAKRSRMYDNKNIQTKFIDYFFTVHKLNKCTVENVFVKFKGRGD